MAGSSQSDTTNVPCRQPVWGLAGLFGAIALILALYDVARYQFNVVTYTVQTSSYGALWPAYLFVVGAVLTLFASGVLAGRGEDGRADPYRVGAVLSPLLLALPLAVYAFLDAVPPFAWSLLLIVGVAWAGLRIGATLTLPALEGPQHRAAVVSLVVLVAALTAVHTHLQYQFFNHLMLGHADFGHFTEELKNALAGRGLRSDSFSHTRLGWHFVPLLYALVPGYALFPSPVYLMVCGAAFVHLPALPVYYLGRRVSGSVPAAWMFAVAWMLLPSQSRAIYSNTYGFQWISVGMPLVCMMIAAAAARRWRVSVALVGVLLLVKETVAAATFGWGLYLALFTQRRRAGAAIMLVSVTWLLLCVKVLIPWFSDGGAYERLSLFGSLGESITRLVLAPVTQPTIFVGRLLRHEAIYFLLLLVSTMGLLPLLGWRLCVAAVPSLLLILLLENPEWLSIKFWHQCTVLPFLFCAAVVVVDGGRMPPGDGAAQRSGRAVSILRWLAGRPEASRRDVCCGTAAAMLTAASIGHFFYGFSPVAKAYAPVAVQVFAFPEPKLEAVQALRAGVPQDKTILATERLAAHFTDYRRLYTGRRQRPADYVIIDRGDRWDTSGLPQQSERFARDPAYAVFREFGSVIVFERQPVTPMELERQ